MTVGSRGAERSPPWSLLHGIPSAVPSRPNATRRRTPRSARQLRRQRCRGYPRVGTGQDGEWFEDSFCVFDVPDALLDEWLVTFQQNAAFRVRVGERVELVWHERFRCTPEHGLA